MNIKPLNSGVLVKVLKHSLTDCGILLPESNNSKFIRAEVIAIGSLNNCDSNNCSYVKNGDSMNTLKIGDIVLCPKWNGTVVSEEYSQDEYIIIKYKDILAVEGEKNG